MKPILLSLLLVCACKHASSSSSTSHTETQTTTESTSSETGSTTTVTTTTEAPGKTTTTVEEFSPPEGGDASESDESGGLRTGADGGVPATPGVVSRPSHGPLARRTVTVTERGAETTETHQQASTQAQGATETHAQAQGDTKTQAQSASAPSAGCIGASWIWGLALLVGVVGVLYGVIKFRRAVP